MSLLNYQVHYNPTSHKDVLSKFRAFALARGWTIDKYVTSVDWAWDGGKYDWLAGNSDFLQIYSPGYGSQELVFRFHWNGLGADGQAEWVYMTGTRPGFRTPNDAISTRPYDQDEYNGSRMKQFSLSPGAHVALWLFGNDKHLIAVDQVSASIVIMWFVGTFELFQPTMSTVSMCRSTYVHTGSSAQYYWYRAEEFPSLFISPWDNWGTTATFYDQAFFDGESAIGSYVIPNVAFTYQDTIKTAGFNQQANAVRSNSFTGKRTLIKPTYFGRRNSDSVFMPIGTMPFYRIVSGGLQIGETVTYGSEEYLVFPNTFPSRKYGTAFRIV